MAPAIAYPPPTETTKSQKVDLVAPPFFEHGIMPRTMANKAVKATLTYTISPADNANTCSSRIVVVTKHRKITINGTEGWLEINVQQ